MSILSNYQIHSQVYESPNSIIYRGIRTEDYQPVIFKVLKEEYPTPEEVARYRQEYEIIHHLEHLEGIIKAYQLEKSQNTLVIVLEDFGGDSLKSLVANLSIEEFLPIAIQVTQSLGQLHAADIIHKDINPANIVWNSTTRQLKLIDFGIATRLPRENPTLKSPEHLEGTLAYISPEQTGRMNRILDYRTDLYSLGVTFYELLTQKLPFDVESSLELVHCHLARMPIPPCEVNPKIPKILSDLVMKLLAKNAEDRYQSAYGVQYDLEQILANQQPNLADLEDLPGFELGQQDISGKFHLPQKLYGREAEIELLWQAFERVNQGSAELLLIAGYSGIGKTSLVQELYKPITAKRGYFIAGKFDQLQRNTPYFALLQAFRQLIQQLLTESATAIQHWQKQLLATLGNNAQVIIEVIPEIELLLGKQPAVPTLPPTEAQNRFNLVFQNFIRGCCQPGHPLVIFLDDLQWVDVASLKLITLMMTDIPYLLLIGAYRDNEVTPTHPLMTTVVEMQQAGVTLQTVTLLPLGLSHIEEFLADVLNLTNHPLTPSLERRGNNAPLLTEEGQEVFSPLLFKEGQGVVSLAHLLLEKTGGNPFFLGEFSKTLYTENLLQFNHQQRQWQWDLAQIQAHNITDNVVELMVSKIQQLSPMTQNLMKLAAALGHRFELITLSAVAQCNVEQVNQTLWHALHAGLIAKVGEDYQFVHDRIQQAAYSLIPEAERPQLHWQIGQLWSNSSNFSEERLFSWVDHLNIGRVLATADLERVQLARFNLRAGQKAKSATAYQVALKYLQIAVELLPENSWTTDDALTLALYEELTEVAYLNGEYAQVTYWSDLVLQQTSTILEQVKVYEIIIITKTAENKLMEAIEVGLQTSAKLGITLPALPTPQDIQEALASTADAIPHQNIPDLINLPEMTNATAQAALNILLRFTPSCHITNPSLLVLNILSQTKLSLQYGNAPTSAFSYAVYGMILNSIVGDIQSAYQCGQLALQLVDKFHAIHIKSRVLFVIGAFISYSRQYLKEASCLLLESYQNGLETGDLEHVGYAASFRCSYGYFMGQKLSSLQQEVTNYAETLLRFKQNVTWNWLQILHFTIHRLLESNPTDESASEAALLNSLQQINDKIGLYQFHFYQITSFYILGDYSTALKHIEQAKPHLAVSVGFIIHPLFYFYHSLTLLAVCKPEQIETMLSEVTANQEKIKPLATHAPMNFQHKYDLVEAEKARVLGQFEPAVKNYEKAIQGARDNDYLQELALAYELAARFYLAQNMEKFGQTYLQEAHYHYQQWGASAKVKQLEEQYPHWLTSKTTVATTTTTRFAPTMTVLAHTRTRTTTSNWLDLESVMKAAQTLSGEIVLNRLLEKMMRIVIENAGAQRGFLLLPHQDQWMIEAEGTIDQEEITVLQSLPAEEQLPDTIISYVARTRGNVVLTDAKREGLYTTHPYIQTQQIQSVLCFPIVYQQQLRAILYLENNLTPGAFTPARLDVLKMLSSQIAISLENAQVMTHLDAKVKERTAELNTKIEELMQTRQELVQSETMASLGRLVAGFAHELNTPIGIAVGSASALQREAERINQLLAKEEVDVDELLSAITSIKEGFNLTLANLERAAELVTSFKRTAVDQTSGDVRLFNVQEVIYDTINTLHSRFKQTSIQIQVDCPKELKVKSLPGAVEQILTNLLINSLIHGFAEGQHPGQIKISVQLQDHHLHLDYSDNGKGIMSENLTKIFEPFFTTHRAHGGSGLGMYICYNLITTQLHGMITCESELGKGVTFRIDFPVR